MGSSSNRSITFSGAYRRCRGSANLPMCRYWRDREGREIGAWKWHLAAIAPGGTSALDPKISPLKARSPALPIPGRGYVAPMAIVRRLRTKRIHTVNRNSPRLVAIISPKALSWKDDS